MFWKRDPEACGLGTCGHIPAVGVVGVRDPEGSRRVVGRNQLVGGILTLGAAAVGSDDCICRTARSAGMALGQYSQVVHILVSVLNTIFEEIAVTNVVVGHIVLHTDIVRTMYRHTTAVGIVNRRVLNVLPLRIANQMPMDR